MKISNPSKSNINFAYFCLNFSSGFVLDCWKHNPVLAKHFDNKFKGNVLSFFAELSRDNQLFLLDYIDENYLAFGDLADSINDIEFTSNPPV